MVQAFVSFMEEDRAAVEAFARELARAGVALWFDRSNLTPGEVWEKAIEEAIGESDFFLAFFSSAYEARPDNYMVRELLIAASLVETKPKDPVWFIPLMLGEGRVPLHRAAPLQALSSFHAQRASEADSVQNVLTAMGLGDPRHQRIAALVALAQSNLEEERNHAMNVLLGMENLPRSAVSMLLKAFATAGDQTQRGQVLTALIANYATAPETIGEVLLSTARGDDACRLMAVENLWLLGDSALPVLSAFVNTGAESASLKALSELASQDAGATAALIERLGMSVDLKTRTARALVRAPNVGLFAERLKPHVYEIVTLALRDDEGKALPDRELAKILADPNFGVDLRELVLRMAALDPELLSALSYVLYRIRKEAMPVLMEAAETASDDSVRARLIELAIRTNSHSRDPDAYKAIEGLARLVGAPLVSSRFGIPVRIERDRPQETWFEIKISNRRGLDAREARKIAEICMRAEAKAVFRHEDEEADATSLMDLMMIAAGCGSWVSVRVEGPNAYVLANDIISEIASWID